MVILRASQLADVIGTEGRGEFGLSLDKALERVFSDVEAVRSFMIGATVDAIVHPRQQARLRSTLRTRMAILQGSIHNLIQHTERIRRTATEEWARR
jgi:hypothetical protein